MNTMSNDQQVMAARDSMRATPATYVEKLTVMEAIRTLDESGIDGHDGIAQEWAALMADLATLPGKVDDDFILTDYNHGGLISELATVWAVQQVAGGNDFSYLVDMSAAAGGKGLSTPMIRGIVNCMRAAAVKEQREVDEAEPFGTVEEEQAKQAAATATATQYATLVELVASLGARGKVRWTHDGMQYAIAMAGGRAKHPGSLNVTDGGSFEDGQWYGRISTTGEAQLRDETPRAALDALVASPEAVVAEHGRITGRCGICGRELTDPVSIERGIGPVCAEKGGW